MRRLLLTLLLATAAHLAVAETGFAQDLAAGESAPRAEDPDATLAQRRFSEFAKQAESLEFFTQRGESKLSLQEQPLQTFTSDGKTFGSVFLWKADGRPAVIGTLGATPINGTPFGFIELHWLLGEPMREVTIGKSYPKQWMPSGDGMVAKPIADAPVPAETATGRMVQMRNLARSFRARMTHRSRDHELRLLPQPLYRYEDSTTDRDGAIFAMVWTIGTDPEVLLHVHSRSRDGETRWYWQPIRFTWRAVELAYQDQPVWTADEFKERNLPRQTGPYLTTLTEPAP